MLAFTSSVLGSKFDWIIDNSGYPEALVVGVVEVEPEPVPVVVDPVVVDPVVDPPLVPSFFLSSDGRCISELRRPNLETAVFGARAATARSPPAPHPIALKPMNPSLI